MVKDGHITQGLLRRIGDGVNGGLDHLEQVVEGKRDVLAGDLVAEVVH